EVVGDAFEAYWYHGSLLGKLIAPFQMFKMKSVVNKAPYAIYVTKGALQKKYPCEGQSVSISNVFLSEVIEEGQVRDFYSKTRSHFVIGMIGTFHARYKGHHELIKALRYIIDQGAKNVEVNLVGSGDSSWVVELSKKYGVEANIKFLGVLPSGGKGVFPFLDNLDLYVHPSLTEGLPRVVIEAMSRGRICVASDAGGTAELLNQDEIHKAGDWKKLAKDVLNIYNLESEDRVRLALKNLHISRSYVEEFLQNKRVKYLSSIINKSNGSAE